MTGVRIQGERDLRRVAGTLREAGDKRLNRKVSAAIRLVARPIGIRVLREGAKEMPRRGGFAGVVEAGKVGIRAGFSGRNPSVSIQLRNEGADMKSLDAGILRHPVFGNKSAWTRQDVPEQAFTRAFEEESKPAQVAVAAAAKSTLNEIAREF